MSDADLISQAQRGDEAAWETLIREQQEAVFRLAYLRLGDADEAADVAQETFIRAFRSLASFDQSRPVRPWLLTMTTHLASNRRRSWGRYVAALQRAWRATPQTPALLAERSSQQWEAQTLWQAVQRLRAVDQEVLYLRYFLDLSEAEMCDVLHIAPGTVKSRLHRALGRLRTVVDGEFPALRQERQL